MCISSIIHTCSTHYSTTQLKAWTAAIENKEKWQTRLSQDFVILAKDQRNIIAIASLKENEFDLMYVDDHYQSQGVGSFLFKKIIEEAKERKLSQLDVYASDTAFEFFKRKGFKLIQRNTIQLGEVEIENNLMQLILDQ